MRAVRSLTLSVRCGPTRYDRWQIHVKSIPASRVATVLAQGRRAVVERAVREVALTRLSLFRTLHVSLNTLNRLDDASLRDIMASLERMS
jgi:hypothetical protein